MVLNTQRLPKRLLAYIFFLVLLYFSTDLVLAIPRQDVFKLHKVPSSQFSPFEREFPFSIHSFSQNRDFTHTVEISGWAYLQTGQIHQNKQIKLVFVSPKKSYSVDTSLQQIFNKEIFGAYRTYGLQHGFITRFSPVKMEDGIYQLHIYCYENEASVGYMDTGKRYQKSTRDFVELVENPPGK
jgi:hypothetical protein